MAYDSKFNARKVKQQYLASEYDVQKIDEQNVLYQMIDKATYEVVKTPIEYQRYLTLLSRFERYSVANVLLIYKQCPKAVLIKDYNAWRDIGVSVKKGEKGFSILQPMEQVSSSGKAIVSYNAKKMYDVSQTNVKAPSQYKLDYDFQAIAAMLLDIAPVEVKLAEQLSATDKEAYYDAAAKTLYVKKSCNNGATLCGSIAVELGHAYLARNAESYSHKDMEFHAMSIGYMIAKKFRKEIHIPYQINVLEHKSAKEIRFELSRIRSAYIDLNYQMSKRLTQPRRKHVKEQAR